MVRKKTTSKKQVSKEKVLKPKKEIVVARRTPSYVNLVYGAVTVVVLFLLVFFAVRTFTNHNAGEITEESVTDRVESEKYTVKEGDTLWSIAEAKLGSGYEWKELVAVNQIKDPTNLEAGTQLVIPEKDEIATETSMTTNSTPSATSQPTVTSVLTLTPMPTSQPGETVPETSKITGTEYVVKPGDTLWDISISAYGDGYKWVEIARTNKLENPDLIFSGNKLILPR